MPLCAGCERVPTNRENPDFTVVEDQSTCCHRAERELRYSKDGDSVQAVAGHWVAWRYLICYMQMLCRWTPRGTARRRRKTFEEDDVKLRSERAGGSHRAALPQLLPPIAQPIWIRHPGVFFRPSHCRLMLTYSPVSHF